MYIMTIANNRKILRTKNPYNNFWGWRASKQLNVFAILTEDQGSVLSIHMVANTVTSVSGDLIPSSDP